MSSAFSAKNSLSRRSVDEAHRLRPALLHLLHFVLEACRRQHDAAGVAARLLERFFQREVGPLVVGRDELAMHMAGPDAQLHHHRRVARFRELEGSLHRGDDRRQVRPRVEQPDLRLHRERMAALLHDRRTLAVVLADDDHRAAGDAARREIRQRIRRDVGTDRRLERHRAAQRVIDRCGQRRCGGRLARAVFETDAVLGQDVLRVGKHVHEMRDRRALVAGDIGDAGFEQGLGDREDALAVERLAAPEPQLLDFLDEGPFSHLSNTPVLGVVRRAIRLAPHPL